jgi:hypothetical protein
MRVVGGLAAPPRASPPSRLCEEHALTHCGKKPYNPKVCFSFGGPLRIYSCFA